MLSRTANDLFWLSRYTERAENMARLLDVGYRMALTPSEGQGHKDQWLSTLTSAGCAQGFLAKHREINLETIVDFLLFDSDNPSSVFSCLATVRRNARAVRTALTRELWEAINSTWIDLAATRPEDVAGNELPGFLNWIKERSAVTRGMMAGTMLRNDAYFFFHIGSNIERADNTARILDVKYYILLPESEAIGGGVDNFQWLSILRSVSAHRSYRWVYRDSYKPWLIADYLILNQQMPRSLAFCYARIREQLSFLESFYGARHASHEIADEIFQIFTTTDMNRVFQGGLHEFLVDFIARNNRLNHQISVDYHFNA